MADLFPDAQTSFKSKLQSAVHSLAASNIFIGTSSWKYPGWTGQIYDEQRYHYRGKFAETRFERDCLVEYAETFKTVCVDAAYYQFPSAKYLTGLVQKVPGDFQCWLGYLSSSPPLFSWRNGCVSIRPSRSSTGSRNSSSPSLMAPWPASGWARYVRNSQSHHGRLKPKLLSVSWRRTE